LYSPFSVPSFRALPAQSFIHSLTSNRPLLFGPFFIVASHSSDKSSTPSL
jgi:hypothetical protein